MCQYNNNTRARARGRIRFASPPSPHDSLFIYLFFPPPPHPFFSPRPLSVSFRVAILSPPPTAGNRCRAPRYLRTFGPPRVIGSPAAQHDGGMSATTRRDGCTPLRAVTAAGGGGPGDVVRTDDGPRGPYHRLAGTPALYGGSPVYRPAS